MSRNDVLVLRLHADVLSTPDRSGYDATDRISRTSFDYSELFCLGRFPRCRCDGDRWGSEVADKFQRLGIYDRHWGLGRHHGELSNLENPEPS